MGRRLEADGAAVRGGPALDLTHAAQADVLDPTAPRLRETPSQTAGPYVHIGAMPNLAGLGPAFGGDLGATMRGEGARGEPVVLAGRVLDGLGEPMRDAIVECWQADAGGRFEGEDGADPAFSGFGRSACDEGGEWRFETVVPGGVPWHDGRMQAPHASLLVMARGINVPLHTRFYFGGHPANAGDPLLSAVGCAARAATMVAERAGDGAWRLDIRVQRGPAGEAETVFLDM